MNQSLLWRLEKKGYQTSYVFGTMHVKSKLVFRRIEELKVLIANSEIFAAEYNLDELQSEANMADLQMRDGLSLGKLLGVRKFERIRKSILKAFSIDILPFEKFLPLILVNVIGEAILSKDYKQPLDVYLWNYAKSVDIKLEGIETLDSQKNILKKIDLKDQVKMLKDLSMNTSKYRKSIVKMAEWYEEEQIQKLYKHGKRTLGKYKDLLLKQRNYVMQERFDEMASKSIVFFAVGAGHLSGNHGVLKLLKSKGWKVKSL